MGDAGIVPSKILSSQAHFIWHATFQLRSSVILKKLLSILCLVDIFTLLLPYLKKDRVI